MEEQKQIQIEYRLAKIVTANFETNEKNLKDSEGEFQTEVQFSYNDSLHTLCCRLNVNLTQEEKTVMSSILDCFFEITTDSIERMKSNDNIVIPAQILIQFASLGYGTMRGVIHSKTEGTAFNRFILPPIYFHTIIKNDFVINK